MKWLYGFKTRNLFPAWKAVFFFLLFERGKNTKNAEQFFEMCISELQVNVRGEDSAASSVPRKSTLGGGWGSSFPARMMSVCCCVVLVHTDFTALHCEGHF